MRIFLDGYRHPPKGWLPVYWAKEAIGLLQTGKVTHISLDFELNNKCRDNGYDVIKWIESAVESNRLTPPVIQIHAANLPAKAKMELAIRNIAKRYTNQF